MLRGRLQGTRRDWDSQFVFEEYALSSCSIIWCFDIDLSLDSFGRSFNVDRLQVVFWEACKLLASTVLKNSIFEQTFVGIKNVPFLPVCLPFICNIKKRNWCSSFIGNGFRSPNEWTTSSYLPDNYSSHHLFIILCSGRDKILTKVWDFLWMKASRTVSLLLNHLMCWCDLIKCELSRDLLVNKKWLLFWRRASLFWTILYTNISVKVR